MPNLALVTGASSGLGREFARLHAARGGDVILTARNADALTALKVELEAAHGIAAQVVVQDLGAQGGAAALMDAVAGHDIDILINNAGFGGSGAHVDRDLARDQSMIAVNIGALVTLTHRIGGAMVRAGRGRILQVGSTAGFLPGPGAAVYFATKAFVNSYGLALAQEMRGRGVSVTVLAPGYVETGFADVAGLRGTRMAAAGGADAAQVARIGYDAMLRGDLMAINGWKLRVAMRMAGLMPRGLLLRAVAWSQSPQARSD